MLHFFFFFYLDSHNMHTCSFFVCHVCAVLALFDLQEPTPSPLSWGHRRCNGNDHVNSGSGKRKLHFWGDHSSNYSFPLCSIYSVSALPDFRLLTIASPKRNFSQSRDCPYSHHDFSSDVSTNWKFHSVSWYSLWIPTLLLPARLMDNFSHAIVLHFTFLKCFYQSLLETEVI